MSQSSLRPQLAWFMVRNLVDVPPTPPAMVRLPPSHRGCCDGQSWEGLPERLVPGSPSEMRLWGSAWGAAAPGPGGWGWDGDEPSASSHIVTQCSPLPPHLVYVEPE